MLRPAALALGAVLAASGLATADDTVRLGGTTKSGSGGATLNLVGKGTVAAAPSAADTELARGFHGGYHGFHGGYHGFHGGYHGYYGGYRGYYGGYRGFYGGYYRPYYYGGFYRRPYYYGGYYGYPYYGGFGIGFGGLYGGGYVGVGYGGIGGYYGGYCGISGGPADANAPVVPLARSTPAPAVAVSQARPVVTPAGATFNYDGPTGPAAQPRPTPPAPAMPAAVDLPVSLKLKGGQAPATKYTFKAYGEK